MRRRSSLLICGSSGFAPQHGACCRRHRGLRHRLERVPSLQRSRSIIALFCLGVLGEGSSSVSCMPTNLLLGHRERLVTHQTHIAASRTVAHTASVSTGIIPRRTLLWRHHHVGGRQSTWQVYLQQNARTTSWACMPVGWLSTVVLTALRSLVTFALLSSNDEYSV